MDAAAVTEPPMQYDPGAHWAQVVSGIA